MEFVMQIHEGLDWNDGLMRREEEDETITLYRQTDRQTNRQRNIVFVFPPQNNVLPL